MKPPPTTAACRPPLSFEAEVLRHPRNEAPSIRGFSRLRGKQKPIYGNGPFSERVDLTLETLMGRVHHGTTRAGSSGWVHRSSRSDNCSSRQPTAPVITSRYSQSAPVEVGAWLLHYGRPAGQSTRWSRKAEDVHLAWREVRPRPRESVALPPRSVSGCPFGHGWRKAKAALKPCAPREETRCMCGGDSPHFL